MALRYRKYVKICKGVRVNFSKTGVSYTVGAKGASVNFGRNGVYLNAGIPGTGIFARERIDSTSDANPGEAQPFLVDAVMDDRGRITLMKDGNVITDEALIRRIKATHAFREEKQRLEDLRRKKINAILESDRKSADNLLKLYQKAPAVDSRSAFEEKVKSLQPATYTRNVFQLPPPSEYDIRSALESEAEKNVKTLAFWRREKLRREYVAERLPELLEKARKQWNDQKAAFEAAEDSMEQQKNQEYLQDLEMTKHLIQKAIDGEPDFLDELIGRWIADCTLPFDANIAYTYLVEEKKLLLDVDLPEIEDIPETKMVQLASGNLSKKKKTQAERKRDYAALVFSLAVFLAANLFGLSPAIEKMTMSCYTQRRNADGDIEDHYILSVRFTREPFENDDFHRMEPMEFCMGFENRCSMTSTLLFKKIKPFED